MLKCSCADNENKNPPFAAIAGHAKGVFFCSAPDPYSDAALTVVRHLRIIAAEAACFVAATAILEHHMTVRTKIFVFFHAGTGNREHTHGDLLFALGSCSGIIGCCILFIV